MLPWSSSVLSLGYGKEMAKVPSIITTFFFFFLDFFTSMPPSTETCFAYDRDAGL